ncbi:hypothetical protein F4808DRAFT_114154 [Astrocystis sublimbata]|nr:hypothetical protein F4808DRAFT_114154 [Astrocystis sublimbata]
MPRHRWKSRLPQACRRWVGHLATNLRKPSVWQPLVKNVLSTTITIIIGTTPAIVKIYGTSTYLGAMASVFGQPGQRFGKMAETVSLITFGTLLGLAWSNLGLYLSGLVFDHNINAAWAVRAIFFVLAVIFHGLLRSLAPRLFQLVLFFMLVNLSIITSPTRAVTLSALKTVIYPVFTAVGVVILVNVAIFPQPSSRFLGTSTIETLSEAVDSFQAAGDWFLTKAEDGGGEETSPKSMRTKLAALSNKKVKLRARLSSCKAAQAECNFELVLSVLPPRMLKPISVPMMSRLIQVTTSLINACESKFALAAYNMQECVSNGPEKQKKADLELHSRSNGGTIEHQRNIALIKPIREIESGDIDVLDHILSVVRHPARAMQDQIQDAMHLIISSLAYCYDVSQLPGGSPKPDGIFLEEMDIRIDIFTKALNKFDIDSATALDGAAIEPDDSASMSDITMETHLVSSFLISISQASRQILEMLKHSRKLVEKKQAKNGHRTLYWPHISWKKWLISGGEQDGNVLPESARKEARTGRGSIEDSKDEDDDDTDTLVPPTNQQTTGNGLTETLPSRERPQRNGPRALWLRGVAADTVEFLQNSDDLAFALKMAVAALLVTWPAFVPFFNSWYSSVRGTWATLQLILVFEVSIGTTFLGFFLRALGTTLGCSIGLIAWEAGQGNRIVLVVILAIGLLPGSYVHLATPYVKAGIISMVSLSVVGLATVVRVNDDAPWQTYLKRLICFLVGGTVALIVETSLYPVRARDRLVESLVSSIAQISIMESSVAVGIDSPNAVDTKTQALNANFKRAKQKAEQALDAARTFLPFCLTEPRIKGNFRGQALVYGEMIHVLFQIIERMDNMLHIRKLFGSGVLEELHEEILPYRRNVAGCVTLTLFSVQEALTTRLPLPQYVPSSRVAQLRTVARVRELLHARAQSSPAETDIKPHTVTTSHQEPSIAAKDMTPESRTRHAFLAWKASSAGMMEIIEYLEELVDLAKLLVGVNAFRSGLLKRPQFQELNAQFQASKAKADTPDLVMSNDETAKGTQKGFRRRRFSSFASLGRRPSLVMREPSDTELGRCQTAGARPAAVDDIPVDNQDRSDNHAVEDHDDIPWSLQRVMSKRIEENRLRRADSEDAKGKNPLRNVHTWTG